MFTFLGILVVVVVLAVFMWLVSSRKKKNVVGDILTSVKNRVTDGLNDVKDAVADPVLDAKANLKKTKEEVAKFVATIINLMAKVKEDERKVEGYQAEVDKWETIYTEAVKANNEGDQKTAADQLERADTRLEALTKSIASNKEILEKLILRKEEYERAIENAELNIERLAAQNQNLELREQALSSGGDVGLGALNELEELVRKSEARVDSMEELDKDSGEKLEDKYGIKSDKHQERLAKLKEKASV